MSTFQANMVWDINYQMDNMVSCSMIQRRLSLMQIFSTLTIFREIQMDRMMMYKISISLIIQRISI